MRWHCHTGVTNNKHQVNEFIDKELLCTHQNCIKMKFAVIESRDIVFDSLLQPTVFNLALLLLIYLAENRNI